MRGAVQTALREARRVGDLNYRKLRYLLEAVEAGYLDRWAHALERATSLPCVERAARLLAAHLLDGERSPRFLYGWLKHRVVHDSHVVTLSEVLRAADALLRTPARVFQVLLAFRNLPRSFGRTPEWLSPAQTVEWLRTERHHAPVYRISGGMLLRITAHDVWTAIDRASERAQSIAARVALGTKTELRIADDVWVAGVPRRYSLRRSRRGLEVGALVREAKLFAAPETTPVNSALELLGALDGDAPGPAVAAGWAAVETLLTAPGDDDRGLAGDRLALLVACSFPRAELTMLAYEYAERADDELALRLRAAGSNFERCSRLAEAIEAGQAVAFPAPSDHLALLRMRACLADPHALLNDVQQHVRAALRRLYRHRNLVLHGGRINAVCLKAALRGAAPLVGAGMDRIAHGWFDGRIEPLDLAARAALGLELVGRPDGRHPTCLLD
ncbi:MAG: integrase [Planctomycetota bacterium]